MSRLHGYSDGKTAFHEVASLVHKRFGCVQTAFRSFSSLMAMKRQRLRAFLYMRIRLPSKRPEYTRIKRVGSKVPFH